jgi:hypothetical protein
MPDCTGVLPSTDWNLRTPYEHLSCIGARADLPDRNVVDLDDESRATEECVEVGCCSGPLSQYTERQRGAVPLARQKLACYTGVCVPSGPYLEVLQYEPRNQCDGEDNKWRHDLSTAP